MPPKIRALRVLFLQVNFMGFVERAVAASPDLSASEARRYHQQWMHFAF